MKRLSSSGSRARLGLSLALVNIVLVLLGGFLPFTPIHAAPARRIVAVADVHGAANGLAAILRRAGLIDGQQRWIGGSTILVQTGDVTDRGDGVRVALDLLMALEPQASAAGGSVQVLLGNHEVLNMLGETQDVSLETLQMFVDGGSKGLIDQALEAARKLRDKSASDKTAWIAAHPPGLFEYRDAFKPAGRYGKWLRSKPILAEIDGTVFMHAGISPALSANSLESIVRRARRDLSDWDAGVRWMEERKLVTRFASPTEVVGAASEELARLTTAMTRNGRTRDVDDVRAVAMLQPVADIGASSLLQPEGPLWFRGYGTWTDGEGDAPMAALLRKYKVRRFVTGHTPQPDGRITTRFGGSLWLIDTGMLGGRFYPGGRASALDIAGDRATPIYDE